MKRILILLLTFAALAIMASYVFIPAKIKISAEATGFTNPKAAYRYLLEDANWNKWWPGTKPFYYEGLTFRLTKKMFNLFELQVQNKKDSVETFLELDPGDRDSVTYTWTCEMESSKNPITRLGQYFKATRIKKTMDVLIDSLKENLEKEENVYGFKVTAKKVTDSVLISTSWSFDHYPGEKEIDSMIRQLRKYISSQHAVEKNYPMLNVHLEGTNEYVAMVAIATERLLPATRIFSPKLVLKGGNVLEAEFRGGPAATRKAFDNFENFRSDYRIPAPAIPYQLMITDRVKETDTSKWITKFYYPVF